jgi:hypothetical protein
VYPHDDEADKAERFFTLKLAADGRVLCSGGPAAPV